MATISWVSQFSCRRGAPELRATGQLAALRSDLPVKEQFVVFCSPSQNGEGELMPQWRAPQRTRFWCQGTIWLADRRNAAVLGIAEKPREKQLDWSSLPRRSAGASAQWQSGLDGWPRSCSDALDIPACRLQLFLWIRWGERKGERKSGGMAEDWQQQPDLRKWASALLNWWTFF